MDNVKKTSIENFLKNTSLFYSILKDKINNCESVDELVKLLEIQHSMNKHALMDLGVSFDDTTRIRTLNQRIRNLETECAQQSDINFKKINQYINYTQNNLRTHLESYGLNAAVDIEATFNVKFKISIYNNNLKFSAFYPRDEEDEKQQIQKQRILLESLRSNFDTFTSGKYSSNSGEEVINLTEKNLSKLQIIIEKLLGCDIESIKYELKGDKENFYIDTYSFTINTLDTSRCLADAMSSY